MTLQERLNEDAKGALRGHNQVRLSILRQVRAAVHNEEIARQKPLDDDGVLQVVSRIARENRESIEMFQKGNRPDLVQKSEAELEVLLEYLPQQLPREEVVRLAQQVIQEVGARGPVDRGKVMGRLMPQVRGKTDGTQVNAVVTELLEAMAT
ncbi:MAG: GatB/YqeY domain-containing protein [Dehalococcoidia bacterium]|nr:GatB/YqeY domain-containing protein [Dehalococcoidia bacterium]